ncbi:MAG: gfo/Idh/MocA family oxidoreductase, partial [Geobacter sp.]
DLMIHYIDIIQNIVKSPIKQINSIGAPVFTTGADIANARLEFENGCVANVTASRISLKSERRMRVFQADAYITVDFQTKKLAIMRKGAGEMFPGVPSIDIEEKTFDQGDALKSEIEAFLDAVTHGKTPIVTGEDGRRALETALLINKNL